MKTFPVFASLILVALGRTPRNRLWFTRRNPARGAAGNVEARPHVLTAR